MVFIHKNRIGEHTMVELDGLAQTEGRAGIEELQVV
jgi:hypothetical protein